jgi:hypothetical protein
MNQIVKMDKIDDFDTSIQALQARTNNYLLEKALVAQPRQIFDIINALGHISSVSFKVTDVAPLMEIIRNGDDISSVDQNLLDRLEDALEARRLLGLCVEIREGQGATSYHSR